jgi:hypothetical protein
MAGDPVALLQTFVQGRKTVSYKGNFLYFELVKVPATYVTAWRSSASGGSYTIGDIWLFLHYKSLGFDRTAYVKDCQRKGFSLISTPDQDAILSFFETNAPYCESTASHPLLQQCKALERPFCTKEMLLSSNTSFKYLLDHCRPYLQEARPKSFTQRYTVLESITRNSDLDQSNLILIVPAISVPGNISLSNARQFLEQGNYEVPSSDRVVPPVLVSKQLRDRWLTFEVHDRVSTFSPRQWSRVVCVFLHAPKYQFKDWTGYVSVSKIFEQVRGFCLKYQDGGVEEEVVRWAVKVLEVGRSRRHLDRVAQTEFWREMEAFLWGPRNC